MSKESVRKNIKNLSTKDLIKFTKELRPDFKPNSKSFLSDDIDKRRKKMIRIIQDAVKEYESYKMEKIDRYKIIENLGKKGKDGIVKLVLDTHNNNKQMAMKCFRKNKNITDFTKEIYLQEIASKAGIAPKIRDADNISMYIVMEKLEKTLFEVLKENKGKMSISDQKQMVKIIDKLDECGVFHGDPSPLNFMYSKRGKLYVIDFGLSSYIDSKLIKKNNTSCPNKKFMLIGFILQMRKFVGDSVRYEFLEKVISNI